MNIFKYLVFLSIFFLQHNSYGQLDVNFLVGPQVPGMQDLKFKEFDVNNNYKYIKMVRTTKTQSRISFVLGLNIIYWVKNYGFKLEYLDWANFTKAITFEDKNYSPPFFKIKEKHRALYLIVSRKFKIPFTRDKEINKSYSYIEGGYGFAKTEVQHGLQTVQPSLQAAYGFATNFSKRLFFTGTFKYVLTSDVDNRAPILGEGTIVDTSGSPVLLRNGAHFDTRYHMFLFGLQYLIF